MERSHPIHPHRHSARLRGIAWCACLLAAACFGASGARAAPVSASVGFAYDAGPSDHITRSVLATGSVSPVPGFQATAGAMRFNDSRVGEGNGVLGGIGFPVAPLTTFKAWGYRYIGDESFEAWRVKAGPELGLPRGTLGLYYAHYEDDADGQSDSAIGELAVSLVPGLTGRMSASYADAGDEVASTHGSVGLGWRPVHALEFSGDIGVARNGWTTAPFPTRRDLGLPLLGGGDESSEPSRSETATESTYTIGVTVVFP